MPFFLPFPTEKKNKQNKKQKKKKQKKKKKTLYIIVAQKRGLKGVKL